MNIRIKLTIRAMSILAIALITAMVIMAGCASSIPAQKESVSQNSNPPEFVQHQAVQEWTNKGQELYDQGKYEEAIKAFDKSYDLFKHLEHMHPSEWMGFEDSIWESKGNAFAKLGKFDDAIIDYDRIIDQGETKDGTPWYHKAWAYSSKHDRSNTLSNLKEAVRRFGGNGFKEKAQKDNAFQWLWSDEGFKTLTTQVPDAELPTLIKSYTKYRKTKDTDIESWMLFAEAKEEIILVIKNSQSMDNKLAKDFIKQVVYDLSKRALWLPVPWPESWIPTDEMQIAVELGPKSVPFLMEELASANLKSPFPVSPPLSSYSPSEMAEIIFERERIIEKQCPDRKLLNVGCVAWCFKEMKYVKALDLLITKQKELAEIDMYIPNPYCSFVETEINDAISVLSRLSSEPVR